MKKFFLLFIVTIVTAQPSRIELQSHYSSTLGTTKQFNIFLPEGYDSESDRYPVVYLFRGAVDEWADPSEDASRRGNIKTVVDSLFAKKKIGKMILVMPGVSAPATQQEYTYLITDLIPHIDNTYRTLATRWHRGMDGFSLGGLIVTNLLATAPHLFCSAGSYDGTLSLFNSSLFTNASSQLLYHLKQVQFLYHTAVQGGNNGSNNAALFSILNSKGIYNFFPTLPLLPEAQHNWYYADYHMAITLPLHWSKFQNTPQSLPVNLKSPADNLIYNGTLPIMWSRLPSPNTVRTHILYSSNNGKVWHSLFSTTQDDSLYQWNTLTTSDGTRYRIKLICTSDTLFGCDESGTFTINNPGNGAPDIELTNLSAGDTLSGLSEIQWIAADADGDPLTLTLSISFNSTEWNILAPTLANTGTTTIDTKTLPNSRTAYVSLECSDGIATTRVVSERLIVYNKRFIASHIPIIHTSGVSDAVITITASDLSVLNGKQYSIHFNESNGKKTYSIFNAHGEEVVKDADELDGQTEGPLFDGMRLLVQDYPTPIVSSDSSRWVVGTSTLIGDIRLLNIYLETDTVSALAKPSDYEIRISDTFVDTSLALYGADAMPIKFSVWNTTQQQKIQCIFVELDGNHTISAHDELFFIEKDSSNNNILTWHVLFMGNEHALNPLPNDIFRIKILKPLTSDDTYHFFATPLTVQHSNAVPTYFSLEQNYPNPFNPITKINFSVNNPSEVRLAIYDILGREIAVPVNQKLNQGMYTVEFNGKHLPSGVYFYRLQAKNYTSVKKMMLVK